MNSYLEFGKFLHDYGGYAMATVFCGLALMERRERQAIQAKFEAFVLRELSQMNDLASEQVKAVTLLETSVRLMGGRLDSLNMRKGQ